MSNIIVDNLSIGFYSAVDKVEEQVLKNFSATFEFGKVISLFGDNATGKSTFLNWIAGFKKKDSIYNKSFDRNKYKVGYVIQNSANSLLDWISPLENVIFPESMNSYNSELIINAYKLCQKFQFDLEWNKLTYKLSIGQKQKLALIRELFNNPDILLIDEGFVAIDYRRRLKTIENLRKWATNNNKLIINISHHIEESVSFSDKIFILDNGEIKKEIILSHPLSKQDRINGSQEILKYYN